MPYIKELDRLGIEDGYIEPETPGQLNFAFTMYIKRYIQQRGSSYETFNDILGALEGCRMEFYRRVVAPYEDEKIKENGDVY
jgi:hypothetical protein